MWKKNSNNAAFSLLEVLLASIIFIISIVGIFATLNAVRGPVTNKENQLAAAVFGKQVLETLYSQVSEATYYSVCGSSPCPNFDLSLGIHHVTQATLSGVGLTWPAKLVSSNTVCDANGCLIYTVSCADGSGACGVGTTTARKVDLSIDWPSVP